MERRTPDDGRWPCQAKATGVEQKSELAKYPRLVCFLYLVLRDGPSSPGDIEQAMINSTDADGRVVYTNGHLLALAESHATFLLDL